MRMGNSTDSLTRCIFWGLALAVLFAAGCGLRAVPLYRSDASRYGYNAALPVVERDQFLAELGLYKGTPYRMGGNSLSGVDCSGLVRAVYGAFGVRIPRTVVDQYGQGVVVGRGAVNAGDLVFFGNRRNPTHVGIAVSRDRMVHASSSRGVVVEDIDEFANGMGLAGARRVANVR
jgi:hypothetical protein